jgi:hypothetical protein
MEDKLLVLGPDAPVLARLFTAGKRFDKLCFGL